MKSIMLQIYYFYRLATNFLLKKSYDKFLERYCRFFLKIKMVKCFTL